MNRAIVVGGGLAGAAAAARLGPRALLLEREAGAHDKICGEFLSGEAGGILAGLGFDLARLGGARIDRMRLHAGRRTVETRLPFVATGISRRVLDAALLEHASMRGACVRRGMTVRHLEGGKAMTNVGELEAGPLLLATGKHELRGLKRDPAGTIAGLIGFKMFFRGPALAARIGSAVEVTLFDGGYAGLQPVEGGRVNLCLLVDAARMATARGWPGLFAGLVAEPGLAALAAAEPLLERPLSISGVPYGFLAEPCAADGLWRLGDQAAVIPSFCGDGMAMALHSGSMAGEMLLEGADANAFQARLRRDTARQVRLATGLQRFAMHPVGRFALLAGLGAMPAAMALLARWTRVAKGSAAPAQASNSVSQYR